MAALRFLTGLALRALAILLVLTALGLGLIALSLFADNDAAVAEAARAAAHDPAFAAAQQHHGNWHFSESYELSMLLYESGRQSLSGAIEAWVVTWQPPAMIWDNLRVVADDLNAGVWQSYERYWHGTLALHRLGLSVMDYGVFVLLCAFAMWCALAVLIGTLGRVVGLAPALAFAVVSLPLAGLEVMQSAPTLTLSMAVLAIAGAALVAIAQRADGTRLSLAAFAAGAVYNYFDFLYYPGALAALAAMAALLTHDARRSAWPRAGEALFVAAAALGGYVLMWAAKWGIAAVVMQSSPLTMWNVSRWAAGGDMQVPFGGASRLMFDYMLSPGWAYVALAITPVLLFAAGVLQRARPIAVLAASLVPALIIFALCEAMSGHTVNHFYFSFRNAAFALGMTAALLAAALVAPRRLSPLTADKHA